MFNGKWKSCESTTSINGSHMSSSKSYEHSIYIKTVISHCEFLEYWNTEKSVWGIWQRFSCLLDEGIPKIWKKLNSHDGFLGYLQNSTANSANLAANICPFFHIFKIPSSIRHEKCCHILQTLFVYFNTLESRNSQR